MINASSLLHYLRISYALQLSHNVATATKVGNCYCPLTYTSASVPLLSRSWANTPTSHISKFDSHALTYERNRENNHKDRASSWVTTTLRGGGVYERASKWIGVSPKRCWITLAMAIAIEIFATTMMKIASDESSIKRTIMSSMIYVTSLLLFGFSLAQIDVSVAYAIWSALGTLCVSVAGVTMFGEVCTTSKVVSMMLILAGVVGLNLKGGEH